MNITLGEIKTNTAAQPEPVDISVDWREYGWVATTKGFRPSPHRAGPREAADDVAREIFAGQPYDLKFKARGWYQAFPKQTKRKVKTNEP